MDKYEEFINSIAEPAQRICKEYGLYPSVCIAQAILESAWGNSTIGEYNLFGRKAVDGDNAIDVKTWEVYNGEEVSIIDGFKLYDTLDEAIEDYCILLTQEECYQEVNNHLGNLEDYVRSLATVYATDPEYADKILSTIRANELIQYDE